MKREETPRHELWDRKGGKEGRVERIGRKEGRQGWKEGLEGRKE
jgi:hypothetical protein